MAISIYPGDVKTQLLEQEAPAFSQPREASKMYLGSYDFNS